MTGEGATDVSPVKRRIANTVDGDRWKKGWMSGREKERYCEGEKSKKKKKVEERGFEEEQRRRKGGNMRRFLLGNDKRK